MDKSTVCRLALSLLGSQEFVQGAPTQDVCDKWYGAVVRLACGRYNWTFLKEWRDIVGVMGEGVPSGFVLYRLPAGCLKVVEMEGVKEPRLVKDGLLVSKDEGSGGVVRVWYQSDIAALGWDLPDDKPEFCDAVIYLLASRIAGAITGSVRLGDELGRLAEMKMQSAIASDRQQDWSNAKDPMSLVKKNNMFNRRSFYVGGIK